jgi:hypothetical protein
VQGDDAARGDDAHGGIERDANGAEKADMSDLRAAAGRMEAFLQREFRSWPEQHKATLLATMDDIVARKRRTLARTRGDDVLFSTSILADQGDQAAEVQVMISKDAESAAVTLLELFPDDDFRRLASAISRLAEPSSAPSVPEPAVAQADAEPLPLETRREVRHRAEAEMRGMSKATVKRWRLATHDAPLLLQPIPGNAPTCNAFSELL